MLSKKLQKKDKEIRKVIGKCMGGKKRDEGKRNRRRKKSRK